MQNTLYQKYGSSCLGVYIRLFGCLFEAGIDKDCTFCKWRIENGKLKIYAVFYIYLEKNSNCICSILVFSAYFLIVVRIHLVNDEKKYFINALEEMKRGMKRWIKGIVIVLVTCCLVYLIGIFLLGYLINNGFTNATSDIIKIGTSIPITIPASNTQVYAYLAQHPEDTQAVYAAYGYLNGTGNNSTGWFPPDVAADVGFSFILDGIQTRKVFLDTVKKESEKLGIDYQLVLSSLLGEQIRIASKGVRGDLKDIILHSTPTLFRSYNVSLGVGGIKISTAKKIARDAKLYGYGEVFGATSGQDLTELLTTSDYWQALYPTYLVKNIITRWQLSGYDISHNPGVVGTLYNMGNANDKLPHKDPQIGGSVIPIGNHKYVYGGISMGVYWYLKIYK